MESGSIDRAPITYRGAVYPWHCDHVGHMNVMWYVGKFDEATWQLFNMLGLSPAWLRDNDRGMAAVDQHLSYLRELHAGDVVTIRSELLEIGERSLRFRHHMLNDGSAETAARTEIKAVHLDTAARRSCDLPRDVIERARDLLTAADGG